MSGVKRSRVEILGDQLAALSQKLRATESDQSQLKEQIESIRSQSRQQLQTLQKKFTKRAQQYEIGLQNVESNVRNMALDFEQALMNQQEAFMNSQRELIAQTEGSIATMKDWASKQFQHQKKELQAINKQHSRELSRVKNQLNDLVIRENERHQYAASFINGLREMIKQDDELLPHDQFAFRELDKIKQRLANAQNHLDNQQAQAALATAQETMYAYFEWKEAVVNAERIYDTIYNRVDLGLSELLKEVRKNRNVEVVAGADYMEVNYWTRGQFADLEAKVQDAINKLERNRTEMNQEQLEAMYKQLEHLSGKKDSLIDEALKRITASHLRAEMGDLVINSLNKQGFEYVQRGYEGQDQRKTYMVKFRNVSGVEIVALISPDDEANGNTISLNTYGDTFHNEEDRLKRFNEIKNSLAQTGIKLDFGDIETESQGVEEFRDVGTILREGTTEAVLEKAGILNSQTRS